MSKEGRTYALVDLTKFKRTHFADAKNLKVGEKKPSLITSSYEDMIKSPDGKLGILKWRDSDPQIPNGHIIRSFDHASVRAYLSDPKGPFQVAKPILPVEPEAPFPDLGPFVPNKLPTVQRVMAFIGMNSDNRPEVEAVPPKERSAWKWAAVVAAAGGAAWAALYFSGAF